MIWVLPISSNGRSFLSLLPCEHVLPLGVVKVELDDGEVGCVNGACDGWSVCLVDGESLDGDLSCLGDH